MNKTQRGFAVIETVLILVVVAIIGGTGYYVWHTKNQTDKSLNSSAQTSQNQPAKSPNSKAIISSSQGYLQIKEWGVKVPALPEGNTISYQHTALGKDGIAFVSSEQKALGGYCGTFSVSRYWIFRALDSYEPGDSVFSNYLQASRDQNLAIKIGDYTYYILGDQSGGDCMGTAKEGSTVSQQEVTANLDLLNSLKGLVKAE